MKVGVIGLGWMGKIHLRNYIEAAGVTVVGVVDSNVDILDEAGKAFGVPTFTSVEELLEQRPDAVSVCVPTVLHHQIGLQVIESGANALIEKPLAATAAEGQELVNAAKSKGVQIMVGHVERFNSAVQRIKEIIGNDVISISIERVGPYPPRIQDVGVIKDLASHDLDLIRHLTGSDLKKVYAVTSSSRGKHEDTALITLETESGVLANISTNWVTPYKSRKIHVACESKYVQADLITREVKEYSGFEDYNSSYAVREWPLVFSEPVKEEITAFLCALREKKPVPISGEDGLKVLECFDRIFDCP